MPNSSSGSADKLKTLVAEIEARAYARGQADARKELLDLLSAGRTGPVKISRGRRAKKAAPDARRAGARKRAPRGAVPLFVEAALRHTPGLTVQEILGRAATDAERSIKLASVRNELQGGRKRGKYESAGRRWSLARTGAGVMEIGNPASSAASSGSVVGRGPAEGTPVNGPPARAEALSESAPAEGGRGIPSD